MLDQFTSHISRCSLSLRFFSLWVVFATSTIAAETKVVALTQTTSIEFVDAEKGSDLLRENDDFLKNLSPFDRQLRLQSAAEVSKQDYIAFIAKQTLDWSEQDLEIIVPLVENISRQLARFDIQFPPTIGIVKSNGKEEGGAAYCRGTSTIVIPLRMLSAPPAQLQQTLTHELFHILSRQDPTLRNRLYETIGFHPVTLRYPEKLSSQKITNPDAAVLSHFIQLKINDESTVLAIPVTISKKEKYDEGSLFDYVSFKLLVVVIENGIASAVNSDEPKLLDPEKQVDFFRQIGRNTGYIIHPEEILADNFVHLVTDKVDLPNPEIVEAMRRVLRIEFEPKE